MAVHKLGSLDYRGYQFNEDLWEGVNTSRISDLVSDFYPEINGVTSLSQNKAFAWFFGRVKVVGEGEVRVLYPYSESSLDTLTIKNVDFSSYPYILLEAKALEGWRFLGWYDSVENIRLGEDTRFMIFDSYYPKVTGFIAKFVKDEDNLGI